MITNPKRTMQPYISKRIPKIGQRANKKKSPRKKHIEPCRENRQAMSVRNSYSTKMPAFILRRGNVLKYIHAHTYIKRKILKEKG